MILIVFISYFISSIHVRCGLPLNIKFLTFLRYSVSASLAGVSGASLGIYRNTYFAVDVPFRV